MKAIAIIAWYHTLPGHAIATMGRLNMFEMVTNVCIPAMEFRGTFMCMFVPGNGHAVATRTR